MTITTHELLTKARKLITKPDSWCQGYQGKDREGFYRNPWEPHGVVQRCAIGAINAFQPANPERDEAMRFLRRAIREYRLSGVTVNDYIVAQYNNSHTHAEVMVMFDIAIKLAKEAE